MQGSFKVKGINCNSCAMLIKDSLSKIDVKDCNVDIKSGEVIFGYNKEKNKIEKIRSAIEKAGFEVE